jgi:oligoribonuclease NrnB/cAMP/cGMP phosphodiesterase (DHH superfamily)
MKIACIYHSIDLDGWMSAAIVKHWFVNQHPEGQINNHLINEEVFNYEDVNIDFIGYNYGQPIPDLSEYDKVIVCDISFPANIMLNMWEKLIWIDHHISAINQVRDYCDEYDYDSSKPIGLRDIKYAACELTWKYFFPNDTMPEIVRLLGRYDCFGHKLSNEEISEHNHLLNINPLIRSDSEHNRLCELERKFTEETNVLEFQYGARSCISNYEDAYKYLVNTIDNPVGVNMVHLQGKGIYQYLCTEAKQSYKNGFEIKLDERINGFPNSVEFKTRKFICINKERFNPINFGIDYHKDGYDGCTCFHYANGIWNFSLYNDNGLVDCSIIAKQFGGGGHKGAAGFRINNITKFINDAKVTNYI